MKVLVSAAVCVCFAGTAQLFAQFGNPIDQFTNTTLAISPGPVVSFGQQVTLTATVIPPFASGKVSFYDGPTFLGAAPLRFATVQGIQATLKTTLASGHRSLQARYDGATTFTIHFVPSLSGNLPVYVATNPAASFVPAANGTFQSGVFSNEVVTADFNGDGFADLAIPDMNNNLIAVLLGDGNGGFSPAPGSPFATQPEPHGLVVTDVNGDGKLDLVCGAKTNIGIFLGDGTGTFTPAAPFFVGDFPFSIVPADFNGDGIVDLAYAYGEQGAVVDILLGNGNGAFHRAPLSPFIAGPNAGYIAVADFNGDGKLDLAVTNLNHPNNIVNIMLGDGNGRFTLSSSLDGGSAVFAPSILAGDFNGDGFADLAVASFINSPNSLSVFLGDGSGNFTPAPGGPFLAGPGPQTLQMADVNGDGIPDLVVSGGSHSGVTVLLGDGFGRFSPSSYSPFTGGSINGFAVIGDFNGDGRVDVVQTMPTVPSTVTVTLGQGTLTTVNLTTAVSPAGAGTIFPATGPVDQNTIFSVSATANPGYVFTGFSGGVPLTLRNPLSLSLLSDTSIVANFAPVAPQINATIGVRSDGVVAGTRVVPISLQNTGTGVATNATITSISGITVLSGTGTVSVASGVPMNYGPIGISQTVSNNVIFNWPATATRARFTVNFTADGGYSGSTTVTIFR
jgi:hypothetical protein